MRARHHGEAPFVKFGYGKHCHQESEHRSWQGCAHGAREHVAQSKTMAHASRAPQTRAHPSTHTPTSTQRHAQGTTRGTAQQPAPTVGPARAPPPEVRPTRRGASQAGPAVMGRGLPVCGCLAGSG
eukprot:15265740-Alexandrium_andersonii.AAC.1